MADVFYSQKLYKCIKDMTVIMYGQDGFEIPEKYGYVEVGSIWIIENINSRDELCLECQDQFRCEGYSIEISENVFTEHFVEVKY